MVCSKFTSEGNIQHIREFDVDSFQFKVKFYLSNGYKVDTLSTSYKATSFGGVTTYSATLRKPHVA